jgi:hypothetical protein
MSIGNWIKRIEDEREVSNVARSLVQLQDDVEGIKLSESSGYPLTYCQRALNPNTVIGTTYTGDFGICRPINYFLLFSVSVFVSGTDNGTNFWTLNVRDSGNTITVATVNSSAVAANAWSRLYTTTSSGITFPYNAAQFLMQLVPTGTPGQIYVLPTILVA